MSNRILQGLSQLQEPKGRLVFSLFVVEKPSSDLLQPHGELNSGNFYVVVYQPIGPVSSVAHLRPICTDASCSLEQNEFALEVLL